VALRGSSEWHSKRSRQLRLQAMTVGGRRLGSMEVKSEDDRTRFVAAGKEGRKNCPGAEAIWAEARSLV
jgi:hypothetical protein